MGGMSASDAAPLPRLGEVFFDVRGDSRSMRLSWYADTGVAVLSIWQGGMCTGTFRLAIADLPRMVETLQRGPGGQRREWDVEPPGEVFAQVPRVAAGQGEAMEPLPGQRRPDPGAGQAEYRTRAAQYQTGQHEAPQRQAARGQAARYLAEPGTSRTGTAEYPGGLPEYRTVPPGPPQVVPEYLAELPDDLRTGATPHPTVPPEYLPAPPEYLPVPPGRGAAPPGRHSTPPDQRAEYLADLPGTGPADPAGYDGSLGAGGLPEASYPLADATGPYPRDTGREVLADDPYLGGTGPLDYPGSQYPPGTSAPAPGDVPGRATADYPAHYGSAVADDIPPGSAPDSAPYDRPQGRRRAANRHAAPDVPFD